MKGVILAMLVLMAPIMSLLPAKTVLALIDDRAGILNTTEVQERAEEFQEITGINLTMAALAETDDIMAEADRYAESTGSDLIIIFDEKNNKVMVAQPIGREPLIEESDIEAVLERRAEQKTLIRGKDDARTYLLDILDDFMSVIIAGEAGKASLGACVIIKDGICNLTCYGDLDCECGNNVCDFHENFRTCSKDCKRSDDYSCIMRSDGICDQNCIVRDVDCMFQSFNDQTYDLAKRKANTALAIKIASGLILLAGLMVLLYRLQKRGFIRKKQ